MNDRKDDIIIGLLVIIIIMQLYSVFFGTAATTTVAPSNVPVATAPPSGGQPDATADPERQFSPGAPSGAGSPAAGQ